jgi:hypothetical protein
MRESNSVPRNVIPILVFLTVFGCAPDISPLQMAKEEIFSFHQRFNSGDIATIYSGSSIDFRNAVAAADLRSYLQTLHAELGNHLGSDVVSADSTYEITGVSVRILLQSRFERGQVVEEFVYVAEKGEYRLSYYYYGPLGESSTPANTEA